MATAPGKNNCRPHLEVAFRPCVSGDLQKKSIKNLQISSSGHVKIFRIFSAELGTRVGGSETLVIEKVQS